MLDLPDKRIKTLHYSSDESIDEFISHKRELKLINGYDSYFDEMKQKISKSMLNTSGLNVRNNILNL